jgi:hypothetical protein
MDGWLEGGLIGVMATIVMDLWALVVKHVLHLPATNWALVGRWLGHMPSAGSRPASRRS